MEGPVQSNDLREPLQIALASEGILPVTGPHGTQLFYLVTIRLDKTMGANK